MKQIYLDNAATTAVKKEVVKVMQECFLYYYGNPSSIHIMGERAREMLNSSRKILSGSIKAKLSEIIFTSGGTESNNLAIRGLAGAYPGKKKIIVSTMEHPSVMGVCELMESLGYKIVKIRVGSDGVLKTDELQREIEKDSENILIVSVMHVNNIIGTIQDISEIGKICKRHNVFFHTDAVQSFGKLDIDVRKMNIDLLSASAHKIGGPKGIGFLYLKEGVKLKPFILGGGQERGLRSGTENVPGAAGFARAFQLSRKINKNKILILRNKLISGIEKIGGKIHGSKDKRIFDNVCVSFSGVESESLVLFLSQKGIYVSAGSACESNKESFNHVMKAIGSSSKDARGMVRVTLSRDIIERDVNLFEKIISLACRTLRA